MDNLSRAVNIYFENGIQLLSSCLIDLVFEREGEDEEVTIRDDELPTFKINIVLYIFKCLNILFHVNVCFAQVRLILVRKQ